MEYTGTKPRGLDLMKILIELLADQEGAEIEYEIEQNGEMLKGSTARTKVSDFSHNRRKESRKCVERESERIAQ